MDFVPSENSITISKAPVVPSGLIDVGLYLNAIPLAVFSELAGSLADKSLFILTLYLH